MNKAIGRDVTDNLSATFASATADAGGKDERTIRRAAARGEVLGDDLAAVTGTSLDNGVELDTQLFCPLNVIPITAGVRAVFAAAKQSMKKAMRRWRHVTSGQISYSKTGVHSKI